MSGVDIPTAGFDELLDEFAVISKHLETRGFQAEGYSHLWHRRNLIGVELAQRLARERQQLKRDEVSVEARLVTPEHHPTFLPNNRNQTL